MIDEKIRRVMIKNMQDSLRMLRHIMNFSVEDFAKATGTSPEIINALESKKMALSATQYIAIAALLDIYLENHEELLPRVKDILDNDGKNYDADYDTSFRADSLLKRWFEDFVADDFDEKYIDVEEDSTDFDEDYRDEEDTGDNKILFYVAGAYKIFLDTEVLKTERAEKFAKDLTSALEYEEKKVIIPLRSIEKLKAGEYTAEVNQALTLVKQLQDSDVVQIRGEVSDPNFYDTIRNVFERFHNTHNLCLITADAVLADEVLKLNDSAESDFKVTAGYVDGGYFYFYDDTASTYIPCDCDESAELKEEYGEKNNTPANENGENETVKSDKNSFRNWEEV